jgi:hypothetical protein
MIQIDTSSIAGELRNHPDFSWNVQYSKERTVQHPNPAVDRCPKLYSFVNARNRILVCRH